MNQSEMISIIVPIYNVEDYLEVCIDSIINQTYTNLEIILVDDGSTDNCPAICDEYVKRDGRIRVIHKENGGQDSARKAGIAVARGDYIGYVDGDDWIELQMYESLLGHMIKNQVSVVESGVIDSWDEVQEKRVTWLKEGCYKDDTFLKKAAPYIIYSGNFFRHGIFPYLVTKLFKKSVIKKYQELPDPTNNVMDDVMCVFPCVMESKSLYVTNECFYHYRVRDNSTKRQVRNDIADIVIKNYESWLLRFDRTVQADLIQKQLNYFIMYLLIAKAIHVFDSPKEDRYLTPFGAIEKTNRIVLYGAGMVGIHLYHYIKSVDGSTLVFWADKNYLYLKENLDVGNPRDILDVDYDYILISILSETAVRSATNDLIKMGIPKEKIKWIDGKYINKPELLLEKVMKDQ